MQHYADIYVLQSICILLHLVGSLLRLNYDAQENGIKKLY